MVEQRKAVPRSPRRVGVRVFRGNILGFMRQVRRGASFHLTLGGKVVAVVRPPLRPAPPRLAPRRQPGTLQGRIRMAPDFDDLPDELLAAMEAGL